MINLKKQDPVADVVKDILQQEALKGNQHKIDKNKNNKIDAHDFKILRGEKPEVKKEEVEIEEGMQQTLRKYVPGYAKSQLNKKMDAQDYAPGDSTKKTVDKDVNYNRYKKIADKLNKEEVEELDETSHNNPFDYKNYKSQLPTKPGEKAGFDSKKISTGTVYTRKPVKDEPMKKESAPAGASVKGSVASISKAATQGIGSTRHANNALMEKGKEIKKEEVEQIDELKKSTLASYAKKATLDARMQQSIGKDFEASANKSRKPSMKAAAQSLADKYKSKSRSRQAGVGKAVDRLAKEEVEQVQEREMTSGETAERERIVKGMKKGFSGFRQRYGDRAKSVMYATATKQAMKEESLEEGKRPEGDTVPFVTDANTTSSPMKKIKEVAGAAMKKISSDLKTK